jgi:hypothetical protein
MASSSVLGGNIVGLFVADHQLFSHQNPRITFDQPVAAVCPWPQHLELLAL